MGSNYLFRRFRGRILVRAPIERAYAISSEPVLPHGHPAIGAHMIAALSSLDPSIKRIVFRVGMIAAVWALLRAAAL